MTQLFEYYGRFQGLRGDLKGLPGWARFVVFLVALPGIASVALSITAVLCSLAALLLVTVPVYRLLKLLTHRPEAGPAWGNAVAVEGPGRRHVDVRIVE